MPRPPHIFQEDTSNVSELFISFSECRNTLVSFPKSLDSIEVVDLYCDAALSVYVHRKWKNLASSHSILRLAELILCNVDDECDSSSQRLLRVKLNAIFALVYDSIGISCRAEAKKRWCAVLTTLALSSEDPVLATADIKVILFYGLLRSLINYGQHGFQLHQPNDFSTYLFSLHSQAIPWSDGGYSESFIAAIRCYSLSLSFAHQNEFELSLDRAFEAVNLMQCSDGAPQTAIESAYRHQLMLDLARIGRFDEALKAGSHLAPDTESHLNYGNSDAMNYHLSLGVIQFYADKPVSAV